MTCFDCENCIRDFMDKPYCFISQCHLSIWDAEEVADAEDCDDFVPKEEAEVVIAKNATTTSKEETE